MPLVMATSVLFELRKKAEFSSAMSLVLSSYRRVQPVGLSAQNHLRLTVDDSAQTQYQLSQINLVMNPRDALPYAHTHTDRLYSPHKVITDNSDHIMLYTV